LPPPPNPQQRRVADRQGDGSAEREGLLRILFVGLIVSILGGFGWWYWHYATGSGVVHDSAPSWAPDSRQVIYSSESDGQSDLYSVDLAGRERQHLTQTPSNEGHPAFAPDGSAIAFDTDSDGNYEIYKMRPNAEAPARQRLTNHPARDVAPSWSPDGRWIVFMSDRDNPEFDVYRMDADGKNVQRMATGGTGMYPQFAPDGAQIAMHIARDVHVLSLKSQQVRRVTHEPLNGMYPTWSSNASQLAFMSWRNGHTELFTAKASGEEQQLLVSMPVGDAVDPRWSPDGARIAFVHVPGGGAANTRSDDRQRIIYVVDVKTHRLTRLSR
jgi:Tol biopolymer transport system component